jgi:hypothetical protein
MYSRVTQVEIDTLRIPLDDVVERFREEVLPGLRAQDGYEGALAMATPEGQGLLVTLWESAEAADAASGFATEELGRYVTLFRSPPGREHYEVHVLELPPVPVGAAP